MALITLRGGKQVQVTPDNASSVADQAVDAIHAANRQNGTANDTGLDVATRRAVFNAANGTGGSISGVDVPDETPVDYGAVLVETFNGSVSQIATKAKEIAPTLPTLDKLTTVVEIGLVVGGLALVTFLYYRITK